jgi:hypothetical protein
MISKNLHVQGTPLTGSAGSMNIGPDAGTTIAPDSSVSEDG